ncbi:MAG: hypothetical protein QM522_12725, partial [Chitinophagaceae bacterium]|nr:hypothetical protein [Chitinophagaceae bacterium]
MSFVLCAGSGDCSERIQQAFRAVAPLAEVHTAGVQPRLERVLAAFAAERVGVQHFASVSGYGH